MEYMDLALRKIMNQYDEDRTHARAAREERVHKVHTEFPEVLKIEEEINRLGMDNFGRILKNPEKAAEFNAEFEEKLSVLKEKKRKFLEEKGIPEDYDEVKYKCEKCLDTGYEDTKKCSCFIQKMIELRYNMSDMKEILHDFSEFSFDYYSDTFNEALGMTELENIKEIYKKAQAFCENEDAKNILYYGGCGLGKTFLSSCIAKKMMDNGKSVIYTSAASLFSDYEDYKFGKKDASEFAAKMEMIKSADLLIIDDLGTEVVSQYSVQLLNEIINERCALSKKIIISTNLNMKGIVSKYTERIASRIYESFEIFRFEGKDIRVEMLRRK